MSLELSVADGVSVAAQPGAFRAVVRNLLANACSHTERGSIRVALDRGALTISDSGGGIADDELGAVFEAYYRGANAIADGEGLGLAIVRRICEHYGWSVTLERNLAGGITARVGFGAVTPGKTAAEHAGDA